VTLQHLSNLKVIACRNDKEFQVPHHHIFTDRQAAQVVLSDKVQYLCIIVS